MPPPSQLVRAEGALHEQILDQTHRLWHDGLTRERYGQYNKAQMRTAWGARHLSRLALVEGDRLLASAKRYDLRVTLDGLPLTAVGIGAVFTPPELRGRGYGQRIVNVLIEQARTDGAALALLFSEIGPAYYERLGFAAVPLDTCTLTVRQVDGAPAVHTRTGDDRDLPILADIHASRAAGYRFSLQYDAAWLQFAIARRRLLCGLGTPGVREIELLVAEEGGRPAAWVLLHVERSKRGGEAVERWTLESCGDRDPSGARVGGLLQALLARAPGRPRPDLRAWWPRGFEPPQVTRRTLGPSSITMMVRPLREDISLEPPLDAASTLYWHADAF